MKRTQHPALIILKTCLSIILAVSGSHLVLKSASAADNHDSHNSDQVGNGFSQRANNSSNYGVLLAERFLLADGVLLADGIAFHRVLLANGVLLSDRTQANAMPVLGDTFCMK